MAIKGLNLAWIVVNDLNKAVRFYTDVIGLKLEELDEKFGWAELSGGQGGARLGIAQVKERDGIRPGQNAVVTLTVENLASSLKDLAQKGGNIIGEVIEVPGVVKMQMIKDHDGNHFQLVEMLEAAH